MKLSAEERSAIRQSVLNFVSINPVRVDNSFRHYLWSTIFLKKLNFASTMAILLLISILVSGGVAVGAEKALPGDMLYPVKVGFNEEVRGWLSVSEEGKANWEVERAQRRLEEAEELAAEGTLDAEVREKIESNFEEHANRVKDRIVKFEAKENFNAAIDVSSKFETSLKAHHRILNRLTVETEDEVKKEVKPIEAKVRSEAKALIKARKKMELRASGTANTRSSVREAKDENNSSQDHDDDTKFENEAELELKGNLELNRGSININSKTELKANLEL